MTQADTTGKKTCSMRLLLSNANLYMEGGDFIETPTYLELQSVAIVPGFRPLCVRYRLMSALVGLSQRIRRSASQDGGKIDRTLSRTVHSSTANSVGLAL